MTASYLRHPHLHGDLITFTAEDDVWAAPLEGAGRAWRVSADNMPVRNPRFSPDGLHLAWSSTRDGAPEVHAAPVDGGPADRLTHWGDARTSVRGWTPDGRVLAVSAAGQASSRRSWARAVPLDGGPAETLPYGPVGAVAYGPGGAVLLGSATMGRDAASWKRYRGGTAGKLWLDPDGSGTFHRLHEEITASLECPMWVGGRIAFLSDHEGSGALYSSLPDGTDLRRHTALDPDGHYPRQASTDGTRVVWTRLGELWLLDSLDDAAQPRPLTVHLGGQRTDLRPYPVRASHHLGEARPDHTGRGSAVEIRGALHWLTHRGGPARALAAQPGVRARLPRVFGGEGDQQVVWVTDAEGEDALEVAPATGAVFVVRGTDPGGTVATADASADADATGTGPDAGAPGGEAGAGDADAAARDASGGGTGGSAEAAGAVSGGSPDAGADASASGGEAPAGAGAGVSGSAGAAGSAATGPAATSGAGDDTDAAGGEAPAGADASATGADVAGTSASEDAGDGASGTASGTPADASPATGPSPETAPTPAPLPSGGRRLAAGRLGRVLDLEVSPDGHRAAVASHDGRVLLVELQTGEVRTVATAEHGNVTDLAFSPDSAWLAWSHPGPEPLRQVKIASTADLSTSDATPLRFSDYAPAFTADGRHLAFLSARAFDPVYDDHVFDMAFLGASRPHLITLAAATPSPFGPQRHGRPVDPSADHHQHGYGEPPAGQDVADAQADALTPGSGPVADDTGDEGGEGRRGRRPVTRVDLDGLADRIVPFPVEAARYSSLAATKDGMLWVRHPVRGVLGASGAGPDAAPPSSVLEHYDLTRLRLEEVAEDVDDFAVTGDGAKVLLASGGRLRVSAADRRTGSSDDDPDGNTTVDLDRVRLTVHPRAEWRQMFDEAHRLMRDNFWRADMGGVDWDAVGARYRPVLDRVATHDDLVDVLYEAVGELGTSHAYVVPPGGHADPLHRQGLLGADLARDADGHWVVARVLPSETSDPHAHSPLAAPGVAVRPGDRLLAVDGHPVDPVTGPAPLLVGAAGRPVELTVAAPTGAVRHVVAVPLADETPLRYHAWVADRRAHVHRVSGGRLGYLHVPDMVGTGWAQLHRDLRVEVTREGLVLDVRENAGGHTSQLVVEKLARRIVGWDLPRGMPAVSYPADAPRGPVVAVADEFSGSDGDIVGAAIKALGIGPVVGARTWGGVIGIDSRYQLVDGTLVTQPKYAFWLSGPGWDVENHGVEPDVPVVHAPHHWATGEDPQLDTAIRLALESLESTPAHTPPTLPPLT